jgi:hypothetical protein
VLQARSKTKKARPLTSMDVPSFYIKPNELNIA